MDIDNMVRNEVYQCVSCTMLGISKASNSMNYKEFEDAFGVSSEDMIGLFSVPNYEDAAREFIMYAADVNQLTELVDDWESIIDEVGLPLVSVDEDDCFRVEGSTELFDDEDEAREAAMEMRMPEIRRAVLSQVTNYEKIVFDNDMEYEYDEVYEHWSVSSWLAARLKEYGEVVLEVADFQVWGRRCSGQSISMDSVIQRIAAEL